MKPRHSYEVALGKTTLGFVMEKLQQKSIVDPSSLLEWHTVVKYAASHSGGLAPLWDPRWVSMKAFGFFGGILLMSLFHCFSDRINLANIYAPYLDRLSFWKRMEGCGFLYLQNPSL